MTKDDETPTDVRMAAEAAERRYRSASPVSVSLHSIIIDAIMADRARRAPDAVVPVAWTDDQKETVRCIIVDAMNSMITEEWEVADFHTKRILSALSTPPSRDLREVREALEEAHDAIAEFYRYYTGGEMRGSYDGKPERNGLWKAMRVSAAALSRLGGSNDEAE